MKRVFKFLFLGTLVVATSGVVAGYTTYKIFANNSETLAANDTTPASFLTQASFAAPDGLQRVE